MAPQRMQPVFVVAGVESTAERIQRVLGPIDESNVRVTEVHFAAVDTAQLGRSRATDQPNSCLDHTARRA